MLSNIRQGRSISKLIRRVHARIVVSVESLQFVWMEGKPLLAKLLSFFTDRKNHELMDAVDYLQEEVRVLKHSG